MAKLIPGRRDLKVYKDVVCRILLLLERFKTMLTANGRNNHVTMFILHLPLAVFSFLVKLGSFVLESKARIPLHYSHLCFHFFKKI